MRYVEALIVGAGPAGLAAALEMSKFGVHTVVVDENERPGGQLTKQIHKFFGSRSHSAGMRGFDIGNRLWEEATKGGVDVRLGTTVYGIFQEDKPVTDGDPSQWISVATVNSRRRMSWAARRLLIAAGASENALAFPGWDLPGVMGAGCAQTFINTHRVLPGRTALMVGSGNVGLIVSYQMLQAGMQVKAIVEAAPKVGGYGVHANKVLRNGIPILTSHTILEARGDGRVEEAVICAVDDHFNPVAGTAKTIPVGVVCIAVGLNPLVELAQMGGCALEYSAALGGHVPVHNDDMETTVPGIYVAGDVAGVQEASSAMEEGRLAGISIARSLGHLSAEEARAKKLETLDRLSALQSGPFGEGRRLAKSTIHDRWKTLKEGRESSEGL